MPTEGPYADYYPEDSISAELLRLLPPTVRPTKRVNADGNSASYFFPLASPAALRGWPKKVRPLRSTRIAACQ